MDVNDCHILTYLVSNTISQEPVDLVGRLEKMIISTLPSICAHFHRLFLHSLSSCKGMHPHVWYGVYLKVYSQTVIFHLYVRKSAQNWPYFYGRAESSPLI